MLRLFRHAGEKELPQDYSLKHTNTLHPKNTESINSFRLKVTE